MIIYCPIFLFYVSKDFPICFKRRFDIIKLFLLLFTDKFIFHTCSLLADDIFLFTKASTQCCRWPKDILSKFCACSSQIICTNKSKMFFFLEKFTVVIVFISLSTLFEISPTTELGKYLGTPFFTSKLYNKSDFFQGSKPLKNVLKNFEKNYFKIPINS